MPEMPCLDVQPPAMRAPKMHDEVGQNGDVCPRAKRCRADRLRPDRGDRWATRTGGSHREASADGNADDTRHLPPVLRPPHMRGGIRHLANTTAEERRELRSDRDIGGRRTERGIHQQKCRDLQQIYDGADNIRRPCLIAEMDHCACLSCSGSAAP